MKTYIIEIKKENKEYHPMLTCCETLAKQSVKTWKEQGYTCKLHEYDLKTQGSNFTFFARWIKEGE